MLFLQQLLLLLQLQLLLRHAVPAATAVSVSHVTALLATYLYGAASHCLQDRLPQKC
jgi:hypothetical protein